MANRDEQNVRASASAPMRGSSRLDSPPGNYTGGCHCGAVKYKVEMDLGKVMACNCSICGKSGTLLQFVPEDKFTLISGDDALTTYTFNKHVIIHNFCKTC